MPLIPSAGLIPTLIIQRILQTLGSRSSLKFPDENIRSLQLFFDPAQILLFFVSTGFTSRVFLMFIVQDIIPCVEV